jgi:hypothetical protein
MLFVDLRGDLLKKEHALFKEIVQSAGCATLAALVRNDLSFLYLGAWRESFYSTK